MEIPESSRIQVQPRSSIYATTVSLNQKQMLRSTGESSTAVISEILEIIEIPTVAKLLSSHSSIIYQIVLLIWIMIMVK